MILVTAVIAGFLITYLRARLTGRRLRPIQLRWSWLVFVAVLPQVLVFQFPAVGRLVPSSLVPVILVGSQALLLVFAAVNFIYPGAWFLWAGLAANYTAIVTNGGWMPISPETVRRIAPSIPADVSLVGHRLGQTKDWIMASHEINFPWLSDYFTLPGWISYRVAFSIGDILIAIGAILLLWSLSNPANRSQNAITVSDRSFRALATQETSRP